MSVYVNDLEPASASLGQSWRYELDTPRLEWSSGHFQVSAEEEGDGSVYLHCTDTSSMRYWHLTTSSLQDALAWLYRFLGAGVGAGDPE